MSMLYHSLQMKRYWKLGLLTWASCHLKKSAVPSEFFTNNKDERHVYPAFTEILSNSLLTNLVLETQRWKRPASWPMNWEFTIPKVFLFSFELCFYASLWTWIQITGSRVWWTQFKVCLLLPPVWLLVSPFQDSASLGLLFWLRQQGV